MEEFQKNFVASKAVAEAGVISEWAQVQREFGTISISLSGSRFYAYMSKRSGIEGRGMNPQEALKDLSHQLGQIGKLSVWLYRERGIMKGVGPK
jgi:hypothetical protein